MRLTRSRSQNSRCRSSSESASRFGARFRDAVSRLGPRWESASRSKVELWDALSDRQPSLGKQRPRLARSRGPKAQLMQLWRARTARSAMPSALYPTAVTGAAVRGIHHGQIRTQLAVKCRDRRSVRRAPWGSLRSRRCPCRSMPRAVARPSPRRCMDIRNLGRTEQPSVPYLGLGHTVLERPVLG